MGDVQRFVALIRGINVGGKMLPMAALREMCRELGWRDVETYIQSGNVVFQPPRAASRVQLESRLEKAIAHRFGFAGASAVPVIVRSAEEWARYLAANPLPEATREEPNRVLLALSKAPPPPGAIEALRARAQAGERIEQRGDALWIHYPAGAGTSKISPGSLDRAAGSPVTTRNWRTVLHLAGMLGSSPQPH